MKAGCSSSRKSPTSRNIKIIPAVTQMTSDCFLQTTIPESAILRRGHNTKVILIQNFLGHGIPVTAYNSDPGALFFRLSSYQLPNQGQALHGRGCHRK